MTATVEGVSSIDSKPVTRSQTTDASPDLKKKRTRSSTSSPYFATSSPNKKATPSKRTNISCIPFPPLSSSSFGLVQESLAHTPFRLLIAVIFLNKTRGSVALPVFYDLMSRYPTPAAVAAAKHEDILGIIQHLGLQNQRARKIVSVAQTWLDHPPERGKRYRCLHYPNRDDGKDIRPNEVLPEEEKDTRIAWEVAHLPGLGAYAFDSWRIFCRDELRGLEPDEEDGEWTRVVPLDKELRAYLRWRWLKLGWEWDPLTGKKKRADERALAEMGKGGVIIEADDGGKIVGDRSEHEVRVGGE